MNNGHCHLIEENELMYVPAWPGLKPGYFFQSPLQRELPFPFSAPHFTYFFRASHAIYHLFHALRFQERDTVLVPAYHSGNEVLAIRASGASIRYYSIDRNLLPDLNELSSLCKSNPRPRALFVIHYLGWPQPMKEIMALCQEQGMILIEDCALSLLSEMDGQPLGTFGDYAVFCLYKTLSVPNGAVLVQNRNVLEELTRLELNPCSSVSVASRSLELLLEWIRSRSDGLGKVLFSAKRAMGHALTAVGVKRLPVGDMGFDPAHVNVAMSPLSAGLLKRFDYEEIRKRRRDNFLLVQLELDGRVPLLRKELGKGTCPLYFPILVQDKHSAARALWQRGIEAVEFWNYGDPEAKKEAFPDAQFLRDHVLELPIHQGVSPSQVSYVAQRVLNLKLY